MKGFQLLMYSLKQIFAEVYEHTLIIGFVKIDEELKTFQEVYFGKKNVQLT
jgi:hypothetical protein